MVRYFTDDDECEEYTALETSIVNLLSQPPPLPPPPPAPSIEPTSEYDEDGPESDFSRNSVVCAPVVCFSVLLSAMVVGAVHLVMGGYVHPVFA